MISDQLPLRAVIFDRDGVLARFSQERAQALYAGLYPGDLRSLEADIRALVTEIGEPLGREARRAFWQTLWDDVAARHRLSMSTRALLGAIRPESALEAYSDALPALQSVRRQGLKTAVLSNFSLIDLSESLETLGLSAWIDVALSASDIRVSKPEPEAYFAVAQALRMLPGECLHIDDRPSCVEGARLVGMQAILLDRSGAQKNAYNSLEQLLVRVLS
jgi:putative hydrolase of the HAD superfamily